MLKADGFDEAVIGIGSRCGQKDIIAYDRDECIAILCRRDGMSFEEAVEYFEVNTVVLGSEKPRPYL